MIDTNPVVVSNYTVSPGEYCRKINFAALSILNLFLRKHSDGDGNDPNPVWGFKFYDSYGKQFDYGKNHFYDLEIKDFEIFEEELTKRIVNGWTENRKISCPIAQQLTCALADIVSEFQWERPEFFSPIKSNTSIEKKFKQDFGDNNSSSNFVFLFTPCPSCCGKVKYFEKENLTSVPELQQALVKKELYEKMVHVNKIALYWLDTGVKSNRKVCLLNRLILQLMILIYIQYGKCVFTQPIPCSDYQEEKSENFKLGFNALLGLGSYRC